MPTIRKLFLLKILLVGFVFGGLIAGLHTIQADRIPAALRAQAERAAEAGKTDRAIHYLRHYLEFAPTDGDALGQLAGLIRERNTVPSADQLQLLDKLLRLDPTRVDVRKDALIAALWLGRYTEAVGHGQEVVAANPGDADAWQRLAFAQAGLQRTEDAKRSFESALAADPADIALYQQFAQYLWRDLKQADEALAILDRLIAAQPHVAEAFLSRARFLAADGDARPSVPDLRAALELDPDNVEALAFLADAYQRDRQPALARECLAAGLARHPADVRMIRGLAWLDLNLGNIGAAVAVLEKGLDRVKNGFDLLLPLADLLVQLGETTRAEELVRTLEARPGDQAALQVTYLKARLAMRASEWATATELLTKLRNQATHLPGLEAQANLLLAACFQQQADPVREQEHLRLVLSRDPNHLAARTGLAQSLLNAGQIPDAIRELEAATRTPFAGFATHAQLLRLKARGLNWVNATPADWQVLDQAAQDASRLVSPSALEPVLLRADLLALRGELKPAAVALRAEAARRPGDPRAWTALAEATAKIGGVAAGLSVLDEGQAAAGDGPELRLARADLYARDPARLRPLDPLMAGIDGWADADQTRLLYGLVEVHDRLGDDTAALRVYQRVAARRPADPSVWEAVGERAARANDPAALAAARTNLTKIAGADRSAALVEAWAALAANTSPRAAYDKLLAVVGPTPERADVCVVAGTLASRAGEAGAAAAFYERALKLDPTRLKPVTAGLAAAALTPTRLQAELARLAADPRWMGEPFRRAVAGAIRRAPSTAPVLLGAARVYLEREPGGLGWLGEQYLAAGMTADATTCFKAAVANPLATPDDDLRLALRLGKLESPNMGGDVMLAARGRHPATLYYAAAASFASSPVAPPGWSPDCPTAADRKLYAQSQLALMLSCYQRSEAIALLERFAESAEPGLDRAWANRNLAMLLAVRAGTGDRTRAMKLLTDSTDVTPETPDEKRATAAVLTALSRHLDGADRARVVEHATQTLEALVTETTSPRDAYLLAQVYRAAGKREQCVQVLKSLLEADRRSLEYHIMGLEVLTEGGDLASALPFAERLLALYPTDFRVISSVARYECQAGRPERALVLAEGYQRTADATAGDLTAKTARVAEFLDELSRRPAVRGTPTGQAMARAAIVRYTTLIPARPDALVAAAGLMAATGEHAAAFALIERYSALPTRLLAAAGLAAVRSPGATEQQITTARTWLERAKNEDTDSLAVMLNLAEFATLTNNPAEAEQAYQQVLDRDPMNVVALNNLAWLLAPRPEEAPRATELVNRAVAEIGLTGELLDTRARIRIAAKQYDAAERDLIEALAHDKTALRLFHLALAKNGQTPRSQAVTEAFKKALKQGLEPKTVHPADLPHYRNLEADLNRNGA